MNAKRSTGLKRVNRQIPGECPGSHTQRQGTQMQERETTGGVAFVRHTQPGATMHNRGGSNDQWQQSSDEAAFKERIVNVQDGRRSRLGNNKCRIKQTRAFAFSCGPYTEQPKRSLENKPSQYGKAPPHRARPKRQEGETIISISTWTAATQSALEKDARWGNLFSSSTRDERTSKRQGKCKMRR